MDLDIIFIFTLEHTVEINSKIILVILPQASSYLIHHRATAHSTVVDRGIKGGQEPKWGQAPEFSRKGILNGISALNSLK